MEEEHNCATCPIYGMCGEIEKRKNIILTSNGFNNIGKRTKEIEDLFINVCKDKKVLIIANAASDKKDIMYKQRNIIKENFEKIGASKVTLLDISDDTMNEIFNHDVIYVMGGSRLDKLLDLVQNTYIKLFLLEFLEYGTYIGESSGSLILDEDLKWYYGLDKNLKDYQPESGSYKGLNLSHYHIYPHYNNIDEKTKVKLDKLNIEITPLNDGEYIIE